MSKRARITLTPEAAGEPEPQEQAAPSPDTLTNTRSHFNAADDKRPEQPAPAGIALNTGTIVKAVIGGLAVVSMILLWKNRRP